MKLFGVSAEVHRTMCSLKNSAHMQLISDTFDLILEASSVMVLFVIFSSFFFAVALIMVFWGGECSARCYCKTATKPHNVITFQQENVLLPSFAEFVPLSKQQHWVR